MLQEIHIRHLPQLASLADAHLQVYKYVVNGRTRIGVRLLDEAGRVDGLARMLGARGRLGEGQSRMARARRERPSSQTGGGT